MDKLSPDELVRRFEARAGDKIEAETAARRERMCILFNQQDLLQRSLASAANRTAQRLELDVESVTVDIEVDHENKRFLPKLVVGARNPDVDEEQAQAVFKEVLSEVNAEWEPERRKMVRYAQLFPHAPAESVESFQQRVRVWMEG